MSGGDLRGGARPTPEESDACWGAHLVTRGHYKVCTERLHVHLHVRDALAGVQKHLCAHGPGQGHNLVHGGYGPATRAKASVLAGANTGEKQKRDNYSGKRLNQPGCGPGAQAIGQGYSQTAGECSACKGGATLLWRQFLRNNLSRARDRYSHC